PPLSPGRHGQSHGKGVGPVSSAVQPESRRARPLLVFFYSPASGRCRRVEGFIAQILQRRHNHDTFALVRVGVEQRPDLVKRFRVAEVPTIAVVDGKRVVARVEGPTSIPEIEEVLRPWLK